jgi:VTC domain
LKKYRKWTGSDTLGARVKSELLNRADSFTRVDLGSYLDRWTEILQAIRYARGNQDRPGYLNSPSRSQNQSPLLRPQSRSSPRQSSARVVERILSATSSGSEIEFDVALSNSPLGDSGRKAVYWVHHEQLIELQVLLLQYLRPYPAKSGFGSSSQLSSPSRTRRSSTLRHDTPVDGQPDSGVIILDSLEEFAQLQSTSPISDAEESSGHTAILASAHVRWTAGGDAAVTIVEQDERQPESKLQARLKRKHIAALLDLDRDFAPWRNSGASSPAIEGSEPLEVQVNRQSPDDVRKWLKEHPHVKPLVSICSRRTRFVGLPETQPSGQWCILDSDISLDKVLPEDLASKDWLSRASNDGWSFPHAVLEVRQEGKVVNDLIQILDQSHLTERVRGFSLATHAVWKCWKPRMMTAPFWLPVLARDIRKVPEAASKRPRRKGSLRASQSAIAPLTGGPGSTESETHGGSSTAVGESSYPTTPIGPQGLDGTQEAPAKKKRKVTYIDDNFNRVPKKNSAYAKTRYWSEYDHPEDGSGDENAFYIYVDPDALFEWPGQSAFNYFKNQFRSHFGLRRRDSIHSEPDEEEGLLDPNRTLPASSESEDSSSSDDDRDNVVHTAHLAAPNSRLKSKCSLRHASPQDYGTLPPPAIAPIPHSQHVQYQHPTHHRLRLSEVSLLASLTVLVVLAVLAATGRRKQRGEVDVGILFGITASLAFVLMGIMALIRERGAGAMVSKWRWVLSGLMFAAECTACGVLLGWVLGGFG